MTIEASVPVEAAPETPTEASESSDDLSDVFAAHVDFEDATVDPPAPEAAPEPAAPDKTKAPVEAEDFVVSQARPWTAERAARAHATQREQKYKLERWNQKLDRRNAKAESREATVRDEAQRIDLVKTQLTSDLATLRRASGKDVLHVLARLCDRDASALYEEMSLALIGKKSDPVNEKLEAALTKIDELSARLESRDRTAKESTALEQKAAQVRSSFAEGVKDAESWPEIARFAKENPQGTLDDLEDVYVDLCKKNSTPGQPRTWLPAESVLDYVERELRKKRTARAEPVREAEQESAVNNPAAQALPGRSLTPSLSTQSGATRELNESERLRELAADDDFWKATGLAL
jgi:hypothetical protein